jgi:hypothetical protein
MRATGEADLVQYRAMSSLLLGAEEVVDKAVFELPAKGMSAVAL